MAINSHVLAVAFILATGTISAEEPARKADPTKQDLEALQGVWRLDEKETNFFHTHWVDRQRFPHFDDFERSKTIEIKKNKLHFGEKLQREITIVLGTEAGKKTISFKSGDKESVVGIYEVEKGAFRVCAVDPKLGGGKGEVRLPETCGSTRRGWFAQFDTAKP